MAQSGNLPSSRLTWPHDVADGLATATASLTPTAAEGLVRLAADLGGTLSDVLAALAHAFLYRYLDQDVTTRVSSDLNGGLILCTRTGGGRTSFRDLAGTPDEIAPADGTGTLGANLLVCADAEVGSDQSPAQALVRLWLSTDMQRLCCAGWAPAAAIERLAVHAARLLGHAVAAPDTVLDDLDMLDEVDHARFAAFVGPRLELPQPQTIHSQVLAQTLSTPDRFAASCAEERLTYRALEERSSTLARVLRAAGAGPGCVVATHIPRSCALLVAVMAILKSGAAVMMLDPAQPGPRQARMLELAGARLAIGCGDPPVAVTAARVGWIDTIAPSSAETVIIEPAEVTGEDVAYVIFTSGSTAEPKAVAVTHSAMVNRMQWLAAAYGLGDADVSLARTALSFDPSYCEMLRLLGRGGRIHFLPHGEERDPAAVVDAIWSESVTIVDLVPSPLEALLQYCRTFGSAARLGSLRWVLAGAEELSGRLVGEFYRLLGGSAARLVNGWGATETTVDATWQDCTDLSDTQPAPLGRPIGNCDVHILSRSGRLMPLGMRGELVVTGACLAKGYLNPDGGPQRFEELPALGGRRSFRSGDSALLSYDGVLHFVGRSDGFLKIRGVRTAPQEVLDLLRSRPDVREAFLRPIQRNGGSGEEVLLYVVPAAGAVLSDREILVFLTDRLPRTMLPDHCLVIAEVPRNASEKVDFQQLPLPPSASAGPIGDGVEAWLRSACSEILGWPIESTDDFFLSGGHSLAAVRLIARVAEDLHVALTVRDVYEAPTPAQLGRRVMAAPPVQPDRLDTEATVLASHAQRRLWLLSREARRTLAYHVPLNLQLTEQWHLEALQRALDEVVERHEILRTHFRLAAQGLLQVAVPFEPGAVQVELIGLASDETPQACLERLHGRPFDLTTGPLLRVGLLRSADGPDMLWVTQHHIITDAWSMGLFLDELAGAYRAQLAGELVRWSRPQLQHREITAWQARWLRGPEGTRARTYWREVLQPAPGRLLLPTDLPRTADRDRTSAVLDVTLEPALAEAFLSVARDAGASPFMAYVAAMFVLLSRWSGQTDFVLGAPFAGRTRRDVETQLGCFVNSLPLRGRLTPDDSFKDVLGRLRETCLDALEHQLCPFDVIVQDAAEASESGFGPLFDVMVVVQNAPEAQIERAMREVAVVETELEQSKLDLIFTFSERATGWLLRVHYDSSLFANRSMERLSTQFRDMLRAFVDRPEVPLQIIFGAAPTASDPSQSEVPLGALHTAFEAWARRDPQRTALVFGDRRRSYGELDRAANKLAARLRQSISGPVGVVAICLERSDLIVEVQLAILKAGHAFLTLHPGDPPDRLQWLLADSGALALVEEAARPLGAAPPEGCCIIRLEAADAPVSEDGPTPARSATSDDAAYVIYTSGSTGRPKAVVVTHESAFSLVWAAEAVIPAHEAETWSIFHSFSFDFSVWETFVPLSRGGRAVLASERVRRDPAVFARMVGREAVTVLSQVPSAFEYLGPELSRERPQHLRWIVFGGEPVNLTLLRQIMPQLPEVSFLNGYGITETTVFSTFKRLDRDPVQQVIGRSLGNQQVWLMDDALRPVMAGAAGEICISGAAVARGYLNQPELTAQRFVHLPGHPGIRLYRSGDFGRWNADDDLVFLGRRDRQVKRSGYRIELDEIRTAALAAGAVDDCAVVTCLSLDRDPDIVAFVAVSDDAAAGLVHEHLLRTLPHYMMPSRIIALEAFPRLDNGKTDLSALERQAAVQPAPQVSGGGGPDAHVLEAMRKAIAVPTLGLDDDFFHAGGHSLAVIRVLAEIETTLGVRLELEAFFEQPTARALAGLIQEASVNSVSGAIEAPAPAVSPASPMQAGLWAIEQFRDPDLPAAMAERYDFGAQVDLDLCERAFAAIFARYDIFRTTFSLEAGSLLQRIEMEGEGGATFRIVNLGPQSDLNAEAAKILRAETSRPFDLVAGPLIRFTLLAAGARPPVLICAAHHAVWDGASLELTLAAWRQAYEALRAGRPPPPRAEREQYAEFLRRQRERAASPAGQEALAFWRQRCDGRGRLTHVMPSARSRERYIGVNHCFALDDAHVDRLRDLCASSGATLFAGVQALVRGWLWLRWAESDVAIGSPVMTRQAADFAGTPGPFLNHAVLRFTVGGGDSLRQTIVRAVDEVRLALKYALTPPELAVEAGAGRLFDLGLTLQSSQDEARVLTRPGDGGLVFGIHTPLWLDITPTDRSLRCEFVSNLDYFEPEHARELADNARSSFVSLIDAASQPLATTAQQLQTGFNAALNL